MVQSLSILATALVTATMMVGTQSSTTEAYSSGYEPAPCIFDNYLVSPYMSDYCTSQEICTSMNSVAEIFSFSTWNKTYIREALDRCEEYIEGIWVLGSFGHNNATSNLTVRELKRYRKRTGNCNAFVNHCASEQYEYFEICEPGTHGGNTEGCCDPVNHILCADVDECADGTYACELWSLLPCHVEFVCLNTVGSYKCLLPAPHIDIVKESRRDAFLTCTSCDECIQTMAAPTANVTYTWFVDGMQLPRQQRNMISIKLKAETEVYKCMMTINETDSAYSTKVRVNLDTVDNITLCNTGNTAINTSPGYGPSTSNESYSEREMPITTEMFVTTEVPINVETTSMKSLESTSQEAESSSYSSLLQGFTMTTDQVVAESSTRHSITTDNVNFRNYSTTSNIIHENQDTTKGILNTTTSGIYYNKDTTTSFAHNDEDTTTNVVQENEDTTTNIIQDIQDTTDAFLDTDAQLHLSSSSEAMTEGGNVLLTCSLSLGPPASFYTWIRDGNIVSISDANTLSIDGFMSSHEGEYQCRVNSTRGSTSNQQVTLSSNRISLALVGRFETCPCACSNTTVEVNMSSAQVQASVQTIVDELSVDTASLHATVSKKTSAPDSRPASQFMGVSSLLFMLAIAVLVVSSDLLWLGVDVCTALKLRKSAFRGEI